MFGEIFFNVIIAPLELVFEILFMLAYNMTKSEGIAILILSLTVSTLVLPLYMRAEKIEDEQRAKEKELSSWVRHIKDHFKGDERYMILDAYYRENHYNPLFQIKSSVSILLQIPFFLAAYDLLGVNATVRFNNASFLLFGDLSAPDGLISLGDVRLNVMPVLMTLINIIAVLIYTRGMKARTVLRSLILPLVFLLILYNSPSALLIYWTMNNLYSLVKTILIKQIKKRREKAPGDLCKKKLKRSAWPLFDQRPAASSFLMPCLFMSVMTGLMIPLKYLSASPEEFIDVTTLESPLVYLVSSFFVALGTFLFWPSVFYCLAGRRIRNIMSVLACGTCVISVMDNFFAAEDGMINNMLVFDQAPGYPVAQKLINLALAALVMALCVFALRFKKAVSFVFAAAVLTALSVSCVDAGKVNDSYKMVMEHVEDLRADEEPKIVLSSSGSNVMVIMLDRAVSGYIPYVFHEHPEIAAQFDGFVYYPNCMSFAQITLKASSALFGGYEYTPERMDMRTDESLAQKHDESLKLLPMLFSEKGYYSSLIDLPYPGWTWTGDSSVFDDISNCHSYHAKDYYSQDTETHINIRHRLNRNLFMYSLFKCSPLMIRETLYDSGDYLSVIEDEHDIYNVLENYKVLENLSGMTVIDDSYAGGLFVMDNETTHDVTTIKDFDPYYPREFDGAYYISDGENELRLWHPNQQALYECLVAAMGQTGDYLDYLRQTGVYDNTRIIIVSDHAADLKLFEDLMVSDAFNAEWYNCLLMVKDFGAQGYETDYTFMTNADVPSLALEGIVEDPVNPYTGNPINMDLKHDGLYVSFSLAGDEELWNPDMNLGSAFRYDEDCVWYELVNENIFEHDNWVRTEKPE